MKLPEIKVAANKSAKTFTLRVMHPEGASKYRAYSYTKQEFSKMSLYTESDWRNFLRTSNDYKAV